MTTSLLVGINAKYIHSNLAIRSIRDYGKQHFNLSIELAEYTINQQPDFILAQIYQNMPKILGFSCYIWNISFVREVAEES